MSNLDRFKKDLDALIDKGALLELSMQHDCHREAFEKNVKKQLGAEAPAFLKKLPKFSVEYQAWYSESLAVVRQILPDRTADFTRHYEKPKTRKDITWENYHIEDYLQSLQVTKGWQNEVVVDSKAAIPRFQQQLAILKSARQRFNTSLYDIKQLVQADLFDSELDSARELAKHKFYRAAGAVCGVLLEKHLAQVCLNHNIAITKKHPAISDLNDALKNAGTIDTAQWRFIQHLGDLRNLCDHNKKVEPSAEQAEDLLAGVSKIMKTVL